jgi:hypothetical protein
MHSSPLTDHLSGDAPLLDLKSVHHLEVMTTAAAVERIAEGGEGKTCVARA